MYLILHIIYLYTYVQNNIINISYECIMIINQTYTSVYNFTFYPKIKIEFERKTDITAPVYPLFYFWVRTKIILFTSVNIHDMPN